MKNMRCVTHDCVIKKVKEKVKRWGYSNIRKQYGWKYSNTTRLICNSGRDAGVSDSGLALAELTGGISGMFGLGGEINSSELPLEDRKNVKQNIDL